uniref:Rotatin n=1 Tax=Salmo trutta TaxID=8032 RepID=A0A673W2R0_SALTR
MELSPLIKKIGHSLAEIRVRALKSIICKLDHSLLSVSDLVQEKMLFVYLLEWFNFPEVPMQEEVLQLISTLSKHPTAAQMLRDVGAVEFLTQLSPNVEPRLRAIIDGIFDLLFQLPELLPACPTIYSNIHQLQNTTTQAGLSNRPVNNSIRCLKFSTFPWLALTTTDQHILSSNESSLRSNNHNLVRTTCELLRDVIMQDFPAEIFLQRPSIVQNLLSILRLTPGESEAGYLRLQAVACLQQLCVGLRRRLRFHRDPSFYSAKQDPVSQNSSLSYSQEVHGGGAQRSLASSPGGECFPRPSVVGRNGQRPRGDGQDGDAASNRSVSVDAAQLELPDLGVEDVLELQLQQLSLAQFTVATMEHAIPLLRTDGVRVFRGVCELLCEAVVLLRDGVCDLVWDDTSLVGMEEKLKITMETLGDIMTYHESCSSDCPESSLVQHRLAYVATAVFTIRLLQTILPLEKASGHLPESAVAVLLSLCLDRPFSLAYPNMAEAAVAYLEQVNPEGHDLYRRTSRAALWMESTCMFLKETQQQGDKNWLELLELADQAIDGLPYHQHLPIVKECIHICSYLWKFEQASPLLQTESQRVLLKLLTHPLLPVKTETYTCTLNVVKDCLGVQNVVKPVSSACSGVNFLLHPKVLYQISAFGLQDPIGKVNSAAKNILLFLLKCPLMMTASTWDRFNQALYPVIPILQSYAGTEDALGNCVLLISEVSNEVRDGVFPSTAKLRAALRLLFTKEPEVRVAAVQHLLSHLTSVEGATTVRPTLEGPVLSSLPSLFCLNNTLDINLDSSNRSFLKVESVEKLFSILTSDTVDLTLRRSAAEQLAVVLQGDVALHILHTILLGLARDIMDCLLEPCVCILRKLVYADSSLRHLLAEKTPLLITLLRGTFPTQLIYLPFQAASHHAVSPYCSVLPPYSDLLSLTPAKENLQLAWNTAWHSGIDNLLEDFHGDLSLSGSQVLSLRATHLPSGLQDCVQDIVMAAGHASVSSALSRLRLHLLIDRMAITDTHTHSCRDTLRTLTWQPAIARFVQVCPACVEDERLLVDVIAFLSAYFKQSHLESEDKDLCWILELLLKQTNSLLDLLLGEESQTHTLTHTVSQRETEELVELRAQINQRLQRELTGFINTLLHRLTHSTDRFCLALAGPFESQLAVRFLRCLRVSDTPRFYGLPSLERNLLGMVSLTAQPGWSSHCPTMEPQSLCTKYLSGLLEVISSFYVEWGGNSMSFMGKGVTKNAVICLLHLSHEMMAQNKDKWSLGQEVGSDDPSGSQLGLAWLIPLWVDRDPEVRFASLGVGSALSSVPSGCQSLSSSCQNISGGLWGTLLNILLDQQESTMVRREAVFILQNLLVMPMPATADQVTDSTWQSPCVHDESSGVCLVGLQALQALLYHCQFFQHTALMATACYRGRYTFDLKPSARDPGPQDSTTEDVCTYQFVCVSLVPQVLTLLKFLSSFSKFLKSCFILSSDLIGQMDFLKPLLANLFTVLTLDTKDLGKNLVFGIGMILNLTIDTTYVVLSCQSACVHNITSRDYPIGWILCVSPQAVATDCRLAAVLHALWPWFLLDDAAMEAVLELLCVYTANCTTACSSLCCGLASGPRGPPGGSLMHCVMKLASGVAPDNSPVQQLAFSLLANLAINKDCKGVLHKSNFLQPFLSLPVPKPGNKTGPGAGGLLGLWLRLLLSVSFGEDGQLSVLRLTGALDLLADLAATQPQRYRHYSNGSRPITTTDNALLILHNVCFSSANKPKVLANDKAMRVLVSCLDSKEAEVRSIGASALWALLHNYQKAKTTLKCPSVRLRVHEAYKVAKKGKRFTFNAEKNPDIMNTYLLKCLENLIQLLNT